MKPLNLSRAFTLLEPGPVVLVTTNDGERSNIMTVSWTMVTAFTPRFALTTGPWNYSWEALSETRECVIGIPTVDLLDTVVGVGTCSGSNTDKFETFGLTPGQGEHVAAPLIQECIANVECRVAEIVEQHSIVVLDVLAAWHDPDRKEQRTVHAVGDGTFIVDGERLDRREAMRSRLPPGL